MLARLGKTMHSIFAPLFICWRFTSRDGEIFTTQSRKYTSAECEMKQSATLYDRLEAFQRGRKALTVSAPSSL